MSRRQTGLRKPGCWRKTFFSEQDRSRKRRPRLLTESTSSAAATNICPHKSQRKTRAWPRRVAAARIFAFCFERPVLLVQFVKRESGGPRRRGGRLQSF